MINWGNTPSVQIERWQQLKHGETYRVAQTDYLNQWLNRQSLCFERLLRIGALSAALPLNVANTQEILVAEKALEKSSTFNTPPIFIQSSPSNLPFADNFADMVLLSLELNLNPQPHATLRDAARVLKDDGYLFLILLNPLHFIWQPRLSNEENSHISYQTFLPLRIQDWLKLLSLELIEQTNLPLHKTCYGWFAPLTLYIARKSTYPLTLQQQNIRHNIQQRLNPAEALSQPSKNF